MKKMEKGKVPITTSTFLEKYPFMKIGDTGKNVVICPMSAELITSATFHPKDGAKLYQMLFPQNFIYNIIGYPGNLTPDHTLEQLAEDFIQIIKANIITTTQPKIILVGISYGGFLATLIASKFPELIDRLILIVASGFVNDIGRNFVHQILELAEAGKGLELELLNGDIFKNPILRFLVKLTTKLNWEKSQKDRYPLSNMINAYKHLLVREGMSKNFLQKITVPTFILGADQDVFFGKECYEETARLIPNTKLAFLHGGHMAPIEHMGKAKKIIKTFFE
jgi:pimeloyl-ACP methyl ester carboxylesterase